MKKFYSACLVAPCSLLILLSLLFVSAGAQQVEFSSTLNPVGSGARATGMGGAFISVADDATAASWNPAGLIQLERPEVSVVYSYFNWRQTYHSSAHREIETTNSIDASRLNYASVAYPFVFLKRNMIISLNYQQLYEMNKNVKFKYIWDINGSKLDDNIKYDQNGYLYALSPAFAVQIIPKLYLGATVNFWGDYVGDNGWESNYHSVANGNLFNRALTQKVDVKNCISFQGTNANFGFLWSVSGPVTIGGVYKTSFDAKLLKDSTFEASQIWSGLPDQPASFQRTHEELTMKMPASYGMGISYRHSDAWLIAFDIYRTEWSSFYIKDSRGNKINPVDGQLLSKGRLKDTTQIRLGTEYLIIKKAHVVPLRAGIFYDPGPTKKGGDDFYGFSLGTGFTKKKFSLDASYQLRYGRKVTGDIPSIKDSSADIYQQMFMMSMIYYL